MGGLLDAIPVLGPIVGGILGLKGQEEANAQNLQIATMQQDFQKYMSDTAHQREVSDLRAAGLNPILSANAGASTPSGASATMQNTMGPLAAGISNSAQAFGEYQQRKSNIENQAANTALAQAQEAVAKEQKVLTQASAREKAANARISQNEMEISEEGKDARKKMAHIQPYLDAAGSVVGTAATATGAGFMMKKILGGIGNPAPGGGMTRSDRNRLERQSDMDSSGGKYRTLRDGTIFDPNTGEIKGQIPEHLK